MGFNSLTYLVYLKINLLSFLFLLILKIKYRLLFVISINKPIHSTVLSYNKLATELDIETSIPDS